MAIKTYMRLKAKNSYKLLYILNFLAIKIDLIFFVYGKLSWLNALEHTNIQKTKHLVMACLIVSCLCFVSQASDSKCPSKEELHKECILKMNRLHYHDCLRANKSTACHGVETRVPFLSKEIVDYAMNYLDPEYKMHNGIEKKILREDFKSFLPESIYNRRKEQFSDGVGSKWIESLKQYAEDWVTDQEFENRERYYPYQTPHTKEAFMYRKMFEEDYKNVPHLVFYNENSIACSSENAFKWSDKFIHDPSAKSLE